MRFKPLNSRVSRRSSQRISLATDISYFSVIVFGLCGAFLSNLLEMPKVHYGPLFAGVVLVAIKGLNKSNLVPYAFAALFLLISPIVAVDGNEYLSHISVSVLPFIWYCAGSELHPRRLAGACLILTMVLVVGLIVETSGVFQNLFPVIGVKLGDEVALRYGSFALNPLALGYFACLSATLAFCLEGSIWRVTSLTLNVVLFAFANSRGGMITFAIAVVIYFILKGSSAIKTRFRGKGLILVGVVFGLGLLAALAFFVPRFGSIFDWSGDEGNLGRLNQWGYCLAQIMDSPIVGKGAGAMSPIGIGDDPYIAEGVVKSCDSTILKLGVEYGAPFSLIYFSFLAFAISGIVSTVQRSKKNRSSTIPSSELACAIAIVLSIFFQQFINQTIESIWTGATFFVFLGYASARARSLGVSARTGFAGPPRAQARRV
jgi:O-Antigen ligase